MSLFGSIGNFFGNLFGGDDKKKKKQQDQLQQPQKQAQTFNFGQQPQNQPNQQTEQAPVEQDNRLHLVLNGGDQKNLLNAAKLVKAKQLSQTQGPVPNETIPNAPDNRSVLQKVTHNPVTDIVGSAVKLPLQFSENYSNTFANLGRKAAGAKNASIEENMGTDPFNRALVKVSGATGKNAQLASDIAQIGTSVIAPGLDSAATSAASRFLPTATNMVLKKVVPKVASNAVSGGLFNAEVTAGEGGTANDIAKSAGHGALFGGAVGGAMGGIPLLRKARSGPATDIASATVDDVPGMKSVNPMQAEDATKQLAQRNAQVEQQNLARQQAVSDVEQQNSSKPNTKIVQSFEPDSATQSAIDNVPAFERGFGAPKEAQGEITPPAKDVSFTSVDQNTATITPNVPEASVVADTTPQPQAPRTEVVGAQTYQEPTVADLAGQNTRPAADIQRAIEEAHNVGNDVQAANLVTQLPEDMQAPMRSALGIPEPVTASVDMVPVAPRSHDELVRQLGPVADNLQGKYSERSPVNIDDLKQNAARNIATMNDSDLLRTFQTAGPETLVHNTQSMAVARAALDRLSKNYDDPASVQAVSNILDALDRYKSKSGEALRIAQEEFDSMPVPMKTRYIVKKIDAANAATKDYVPLADDPARAQSVEATINGYLQGSQAIADRIAQMEGQLNNIADSALRGQKPDISARAIIKSLKTEQRNLVENNGELVKYYSSQVPGRSTGQKLLSDFPRHMMLASFTGRVNDLITTGSNVANLGAQNITQGLLAKAVNLFKPGKVTDTLRGGRQFVEGTVEGVKQTGREFQGKQYAPNLQKSLQSNTEERSGLQKASGPVGRTIQTATELATNVSEGVRNQRLYQLAVQEGQRSGLKGDMLNAYAEARSAVPTRQMIEQADQLHKEINNLNDNPVTRALNRVSAAIEGKSAIGGFIKNQVMPFTSWLGGNIYNTVTDKNVIASSVKLLDSARKGDAEGIVRNLAKTANNAAYTYALGYLLTKSGVITNQDAQGYNDAGAYLHIGDRYVPVAFTGFLAPSLILGNAAYQGLNGDPKASPAEKIGEFASQTLENAAKSININSAIGADNNLTRTFAALNGSQGKPGSGQDALATATGGAAGQFIPAIAGDVNAVLNNGLKVGDTTIVPDTLNPTHEAANTKVAQSKLTKTGKQSTAKDVSKSALASLENRIPLVSQGLPRKEGVAAPDLVDRTTHGNRDTRSSKDARAEAKATANQQADFEKRSVPDYRKSNFTDAVEARVERGNYDEAIEGLQAKLNAQKNDKDIPKSKNDAIQDQIKQVQVLKAGKFDPEIRDLYKSTSVSEWRNMGDPESDTYDPDAYQKLYDYDGALAKQKISGSSLSKDKNKYTAKTSKSKNGKSSASKAASAALKRVQSNKLGSPTDLGKVSFGDLSPKKAGSIKIPTIQQLKAGDLIKKREISVK